MKSKLRTIFSRNKYARYVYKRARDLLMGPIEERARKRQRNVALIGWLGAFNLGDEMMLNVTLEELSKNGHTATLITHSADPKVIKRYQGHKVVPRNPLSKSALDELVRDNDVLFVNGGAMLDDRGYKKSTSLARDIARLSRAFIDNKKKVVVYGVSTNVGIKNSELISDYSSIIDEAVHFSVRDEFSRRELSKFSEGSKIHLVDDIVFAESQSIVASLDNVNSERIAVIMIFDGETMEHVKQLFDKLVRITDKQFRIVHFYDEGNNDALRTEELRQHLGENRFRVDEISNPKNAAELEHAIRDVGTVMTMRYHGALFANMMGKKVVFVEYDKHPHYYYKNRYLREHYGYNNQTIKLSEVASMSDDEIRSVLEASSVNQPSVSAKEVQRRAHKDLAKVIKSL